MVLSSALVVAFASDAFIDIEDADSFCARVCDVDMFIFLGRVWGESII